MNLLIINKTYKEIIKTIKIINLFKIINEKSRK